ncbi:hypothetical protein KFE98_10090 [bacterium SCSIO 12741]|nr:hypothetical protein KFE98_10090 [bacterium SCSIO 12741]
MLRIVVLITLLPLLSYSQIDTLDKGNLEVIDSLNGLKTIYPFKDRQVDGTVNAFYLESNQLAHTVNYAANQRQGAWNFFVYDSTEHGHLYQHFNFVNDTLSGPFVRLTDSIYEVGSYANGELDSLYTSYLMTWDTIGDTATLIIDSGYYESGQKSKYWYHYKDGKIDREGFYSEDLMSGKWRIYGGPSNELTREVTYENGKKNGPETISIHPIDTNVDGEYISTGWARYEELITWKNDVRNGPYYRTGFESEKLEEGTYLDGKKQGAWTFSTPKDKREEIITFQEDIKSGPYELKIAGVSIEKGTFDQELKTGLWSFYDGVTGKLIREENWEGGQAHGEWKYYVKGRVKYSKKFESDQLIEMFEYDRSGLELNSLWIEHRDDQKMKIKYESLSQDSILTIHYLHTPESEWKNDNFLEFFLKEIHNDTVFIKDGSYEVKKGGSTEVKGSYKANLMNGTWSYYFNSSIVWEKAYVNGLMEKERFIDSHNGEPLPKGEYILWYGPERPKLEFKIKEGLRNGKSTWYGPDGKEERSEKYKEGILQ